MFQSAELCRRWESGSTPAVSEILRQTGSFLRWTCPDCPQHSLIGAQGVGRGLRLSWTCTASLHTSNTQYSMNRCCPRSVLYRSLSLLECRSLALWLLWVVLIFSIQSREADPCSTMVSFQHFYLRVYMLNKWLINLFDDFHKKLVTD